MEKLCQYYIALLQSIVILHKNNHWIAAGDNFYGTHQLLDRIYESASKDLDAAAEKFVGVFGPESVSLKMQAPLIQEILVEFQSGDIISASLASEQAFLKFSAKFLKETEDAGKMTAGLEDLLAGIASNREEAVYLLQQVKNGKRAEARKNALVAILNPKNSAKIETVFARELDIFANN
jgi:DNA-binding ferritin-like protein